MAYKDIDYEIIQTLGILSELNGGWTKEVNLISWDGAEPKLDIRNWSSDHSRMSRGIALTKAEAVKLRSALDHIEHENISG